MWSLGNLFPLDNFGDFFPTHSSLSSMSLESEQLQLSVYEIMGFTHTSSGKNRDETKNSESSTFTGHCAKYSCIKPNKFG